MHQSFSVKILTRKQRKIMGTLAFHCNNRKLSFAGFNYYLLYALYICYSVISLNISYPVSFIVPTRCKYLT
jgi:hypothetical protein